MFSPEKVLIRLGGFSVDCDVHAAFVLEVNVHVLKCQCSTVRFHMRKVKVSCTVSCIEVICKELCLFNLNFFQNVTCVLFPEAGFVLC